MKKMRLLLGICLVALPWLVDSSAWAFPSDWIIEMVATDERVDSNATVLLDADGRLHAVYHGLGTRHLKYAVRDVYGQITTTVIDEFGTTHAISLVLDAGGRPHISYYSDGSGLKYAYFDGTGWFAETIDAGERVGISPSLKLDRSNLPHIVYDDRSIGWPDGFLKYARLDGNAWSTDIIDRGRRASLDLDINDQPHVSYYSAVDDSLRYAYFSGTEWVIRIIEAGNFRVGWHSTLELDMNDHPHIVYGNDTIDALMYAYSENEVWKTTTIDQETFRSRRSYLNPTLVFDSQGRPHVSYHASRYLAHNRYRGEVKYAYFDGDAWLSSTVDTATGCCADGQPALTLDHADRPTVAYYIWSQRVLKTARGFPRPTVPAGTDSLSAHVFVDYRCDNLFQDGTDMPLEGVRVTVSFPNGSSRTLKSTDFGMVNLTGFSAAEGVTISARIPITYKGHAMENCAGNSSTINLHPGDFEFGTSHIPFGITILGEMAGQ